MLGRAIARMRLEAEVCRAVMSDGRTPRRSRWLLGAALAYLVSPVDIIPDFIPVVGHLDDVIVVPLLAWLAFRSIPEEVVEFHRNRILGEAGGGAFGRSCIRLEDRKGRDRL